MRITPVQPITYYEFDAAYLHGLKLHDPRTEDHFVGYFNSVLRAKLRGCSPDVEQQNDIRQETFARVLTAIRTPGRIRQPECLGAFVTTVCNNILHESFRTEKRYRPIEALPAELQDCARSPEAVYIGQEAARKVKDALSCLSHKERTLLLAIFLEQKDKDEVCRQLGISRSNLRVVLHRAKKKLRQLYRNTHKAGGETALLEMRAGCVDRKTASRVWPQRAAEVRVSSPIALAFLADPRG